MTAGIRNVEYLVKVSAKNPSTQKREDHEVIVQHYLEGRSEWAGKKVMDDLRGKSFRGIRLTSVTEMK